MPRKLHWIHVDKAVAKKMKAPVKRKLAAEGVYFEVRKKQTRRLYRGPISWSLVEHVFLVYSVGKEVGVWNTIRQILRDAKFTGSEITTLGLSRAIEKQAKKPKVTKKS